MTTLAHRVQWLRGVSGESQRGFARLCGLSAQHVRLIEMGARGRAPAYETLSRIADACGVSVEWLATGHGPAPRAEAIRQHILAE